MPARTCQAEVDARQVTEQQFAAIRTMNLTVVSTLQSGHIVVREADGGLPYEAVEVRVEGPTPTALVTQRTVRWMTYTAEASRFVAAMRALTLDQ